MKVMRMRRYRNRCKGHRMANIQLHQARLVLRDDEWFRQLNTHRRPPLYLHLTIAVPGPPPGFRSACRCVSLSVSLSRRPALVYTESHVMSEAPSAPGDAGYASTPSGMTA